MTEKQKIDEWATHLKAIISYTPIQLNESISARGERIAGLEADPEKWFCYYFPHYSFAAPAPFHVAATKRVLEKKEWYEVRMWSRELAKSTRTMMEVLYLTLVGHPAENMYVTEDGTIENSEAIRLKKKYVLLISNSLDNATRLLTPYKLNLQYNERIIQDYGEQESSSKWQAAEFTTERGVSFRALGAGQSPRGTRNEETRPDILLFDDVDTDADCLNPEIVAKKWLWIEEAAIGTRSISQPTTIIFCGNRIAIDCCIERARSFADVTDIINIRNEQGASSWSEKNSEEDIERVLSQKSYAATQKEYFNNPVTEGSVFKQMAWKPALAIDAYKHLICYTDPSYKELGDYKATVLVGVWRQEYHILKCYLEQTTSASMLDWHFEIHKLTKGKCSFYMEEVFMQDVIIKELNNNCIKHNIPISVKGDKRNKPNKFTRIEALLEPLNRNNRLYFNMEERHNPHMVRLEEQFLSFAYSGRAHDDGPDAVEGAIWLLSELEGSRNEMELLPVGGRLRNNRM